MSMSRILVVVILLGIAAAVINWALEGFVVGKLGPAPPCEVSNTCR